MLDKKKRPRIYGQNIFFFSKLHVDISVVSMSCRGAFLIWFFPMSSSSQLLHISRCQFTFLKNIIFVQIFSAFFFFQPKYRSAPYLLNNSSTLHWYLVGLISPDTALTAFFLNKYVNSSLF